MPMNLVIQEKRKELGLTQEQVAEYLNVSIPAVSKWEKGTTCPDISLLAPLARFLKIDLNTLCCFHENMSQQEIALFCKEIESIAQTKGIADGFETAKQKIHEYPHDETLLQCLTFQLDGLLTMSGLPPEEAKPYDETILRWYRQLAESKDDKVKNGANYMIVSRFIRQGEYDRAQEILNQMPDKEDMMSSMADKRILQVNIYLHQGKADKAAKELQNALLASVNKVQLLLHKMVDAELAAGEIQTAKTISEKASRMAELFDLWNYNSFVAPLQVAGEEKNADECIRLLQKMLPAMLTPWDMGKSPLYCRIAKPSADSKTSTNLGQMLPAILTELEQDPAYDFLRERKEFQQLIDEYKALAET